MGWTSGVPPLLVLVILGGGLLWALLYGDPANIEDKAALVLQAKGDAEAEELVRTLLKKENVQSMAVRRLSQRIEYMQKQRHARGIVQEFLTK